MHNQWILAQENEKNQAKQYQILQNAGISGNHQNTKQEIHYLSKGIGITQTQSKLMKTGLDNSSTGATDSTSIKALQRRCSSQIANPTNSSAKAGSMKQQTKHSNAAQEVDYNRAILNISQSSIDKGKTQSSKISQSSLNNTQKLKSSSRKGNSAKRQSQNKLQKECLTSVSDHTMK